MLVRRCKALRKKSVSQLHASLTFPRPPENACSKSEYDRIFTDPLNATFQLNARAKLAPFISAFVFSSYEACRIRGGDTSPPLLVVAAALKPFSQERKLTMDFGHLSAAPVNSIRSRWNFKDLKEDVEYHRQNIANRKSDADIDAVVRLHNEYLHQLKLAEEIRHRRKQVRRSQVWSFRACSLSFRSRSPRLSRRAQRRRF